MTQALVELLQAARKAQQRNEARMSYSYTSNAAVGAGRGEGMHEEKVIGAGVVNNLLTENDFIESERDEVKRMELFARNVQDSKDYSARRLPGEPVPTVGVSLSYEELEYLGY